jgi:hypothetical protein
VEICITQQIAAVSPIVHDLDSYPPTRVAYILNLIRAADAGARSFPDGFDPGKARPQPSPTSPA